MDCILMQPLDSRDGLVPIILAEGGTWAVLQQNAL